MPSSASGQDGSNSALRLATQAGKMELSCSFSNTRRFPKEKFPRKPCNKSFIDQVCLVKMAGYRPRPFFARLWTRTEVSIKRKCFVGILRCLVRVCCSTLMERGSNR